MKIQLVFAPPEKMPKLGELSEGRIPPLGIMYLASYLRSKVEGVELNLTDGLMIGFERTLQEIEDFQPDILGVSAYTACALGAFELINRVKKRFPSIFIVTGGPHVTALPEEALERSKVDVVVLGEGEVTFHELVNLYRNGVHARAIDLQKVDGVAFTEDHHIHRTSPRQHINDLDSIPFPAYDLIDLRKYKGWYLNKEAKEAAVLFTRGCPFSCTFCSNIVWKIVKPHVRMRSAKNIVDEIEYLYQQYGIREIFDCSDEFNINVKHALAICEEMKERRIDIVWKASVRAYPLTEELVKAMADTRCWYVLLGIESGNQDTINGIKKRITLEQVEEACWLFHKHGIKVMGLFMLFNVWEENDELRYEGIEAVKKTFRYIKYLLNKGLLDYIGWSVTVPYPGSKLYDIAMRHNLIKEEYLGNWDKWLTGDSFIMQLPGVKKKDQVRMKTLGSITRARLIIRNHEFKPEALILMIKKSIKILRNEAQLLLHRISTGKTDQ